MKRLDHLQEDLLRVLALIVTLAFMMGNFTSDPVKDQALTEELPPTSTINP